MKPGTDDKVLVGWNGLMLTAFAEASRVLDREDYAQYAEGLLELYQSTFDPVWFDAAVGLADEDCGISLFEGRDFMGPVQALVSMGLVRTARAPHTRLWAM